MKNYLIVLKGCDDKTCIEIELTDDQYKLISILSDKSEKASTYGCMPTMSIAEKY